MKPFDHEKFIGYISEVSAQTVLMQFPVAPLVHPFYYHGSVYLSGSVGSFVVIEGTERGFLGRLIEVSLPQGERKEITDQNTHMESDEFHPVGRIELLAIFNVYAPEKIEKTISRYPTIGSKVYSCSDEQISLYVAKFGEKKSEGTIPYAEIGKLTSNDAVCNVSINSLFGRHCAVVGTTGGGKSWTVATLLEMVEKTTNNKCILIDATGEYSRLESAYNIVVGTGENYFDYKKLTIDELTFLLRPSSRVQLPKLMEAIRSLKMLKLDTDSKLISYIDPNDRHKTLKKENNPKKPFRDFYYLNSDKIESQSCDFDISKLTFQISNECIWETSKTVDHWGGKNESDLGNCISLISRVRNIMCTDVYNKIFAFKGKPQESSDITDIIDAYIKGKDNRILRLDFSKVGFDYQVREILVNAIGKYLLTKARDGAFKESPMVIFVDEAHQFLNKNIRDEYFDAKPLDAFEQISKEARKYGLFICIATQMPRDIPLGTLSQMGTFIVHRLINEQDKKAVESAASAANRNILSFLPILGEGEAVIVGVDYPMPLTVKIKEPNRKPDSNTPKFACK